MDSFVFNSFKDRFIKGDVALNDDWNIYPVNSKFEKYAGSAEYFRTSADFIMGDTANIYTDANSEQEMFDTWYDYYGTKMIAQNYNYSIMENVDTAIEPQLVTSANWDTFINASEHRFETNLSALFFAPEGKFYRELPGVTDIDGNPIARGFYYVNTKEELLWCANKVNGNVYDNAINIVLGDNIEFSGTSTDINFSIGSNPAQPFEGILYGNGYMFVDLLFHCNNDVNGIVGYLGTSGIIYNVAAIDCSAVCEKPISLEHLTTDGSDVVFGAICGKNNGTISHVKVHNMTLSGFVPRMYSVGNKTDVNTDTNAFGNPNKNVFYPDYMCYNSLGNIIPYIGYFNEGVFATYSGYDKATQTNYTYWNTQYFQNGFPEITVNRGRKTTSPKEWYYWFGCEDKAGRYIMSYTAPANMKRILWYDASIIAETYALMDAESEEVGMAGDRAHGLLLYQPDSFDEYAQNFSTLEYAQYFNKSMRLNQQNRAAYYVSPLVGMNNGNITDAYVGGTINTCGTFVGFIGGLAGKQAAGLLKDCNVSFSASDVFGEDGISPIRNSVITEDSLTMNTDKTKSQYSFMKKSIKNIGGAFGSCIIGNANSLELDGVHVYFNNQNDIMMYAGGDCNYYDYHFMNRFGGIASIVEYNSCNISDMWLYNSDIDYNDQTIQIKADVDVNDVNGNRSVIIRNSDFSYEESLPDAHTGTIDSYSFKTLNSYIHEKGVLDDMYGVSSPLFAEIKPNYLSVPSIITTPCYNTTEVYNVLPTIGWQSWFTGNPFTGVNPANTQKANIDQAGNVFLTSQHTVNEYALPISSTINGINYKALGYFGVQNSQLYTTEDNQGLHYLGYTAREQLNETLMGVGLFTIDQQIAAPLSDPNYWCIDAEVDLPGVSNGWNIPSWKNRGYAGGVIDFLNAPSAKNFSTDIRSIATKLVRWDNTSIYYTVGNNTNPDIFTTVKVPGNAIIVPSRTEPVSYKPGAVTGYVSDYVIGEPTYIDAVNNGHNKEFGYAVDNDNGMIISNRAVPGTYEGNKKLTTYPYFGSDIEIIPTISTQENSPFMSGYSAVIITYAPVPYYGQLLDVNQKGALEAVVDKVEITMQAEAFDYAPFTTVPATKEIIDRDYKLRVHVYTGSRPAGWYDMWDINGTGGGDVNGGLTELSHIFEEEDRPQVLKFFDEVSFGERYGWVFYTNYTENDDPYAKSKYVFCYIPFDYNKPYNIATTEGLSPPNFPFMIGYMVGTNRTNHSNGMDPEEIATWWRKPKALKESTVDIIPYIEYYRGKTVDGEAIYELEKPTLSYSSMSAYKWDLDTTDQTYKFLDVNDNFTLDPAQAATAYKVSDEKLGITIAGYEMYITGTNVNNALRTYWENLINDTTTNTLQSDLRSESEYRFDVNELSRNRPYENIANLDNLPYDPNMGKFRNWLEPSYTDIVAGINVGTGNNKGSDNIYEYTNMEYLDRTIDLLNLTKKFKESNRLIKEPETLKKATLFKYTYTKTIASADYEVPPIHVDFDYMKGKAGFWYTNEFVDNDNAYYNDNIKYNSNIYNIGITPNENCILRELIDRRSGFTVSGFSADDFAGLYITDSKNLPVMYIDTSLGKCEDGTSWSYSGIPATSANTKYGLFLEVNSDE